jgi:hypothetical protein
MMNLAGEFERGEDDAEEVLRATVDTADEVGALRFEVAVWTRGYGPYLRFAFGVDRANPQSSLHPFCRLDRDERDGELQIGNIVADNEATRALLRLIALPDTELGRVSGSNTGAARYRSKLIRCVRLLWD